MNFLHSRHSSPFHLIEYRPKEILCPFPNTFFLVYGLRQLLQNVDPNSRFDSSPMVFCVDFLTVSPQCLILYLYGYQLDRIGTSMSFLLLLSKTKAGSAYFASLGIGRVSMCTSCSSGLPLHIRPNSTDLFFHFLLFFSSFIG